jgi:hypothetical protein
LEANAPQASFHPTAKENEMNLQIIDEGLDSNREGEKSISFFNELETGIGTMLKNPGSIPIPLFHFLMRFKSENHAQRWFHFLMSLKSENHAQRWFHFLMSLKSKNHAQRWFHFLMSLKSENHAQRWFHFLMSLK